jgi:membrane protein
VNLDTLKRTWAAYGEDHGGRIAAAIAYNTMLSIVPLFVVLIAFVGSILGLANGSQGHSVAEEALVAHVRQGAGPEAAQTVREIVAAAFDQPRQNAIAQIVGWSAFLMGAAGLFGALQGSLNSIWRVDREKRPWYAMVKDRAASFAMILVVGFLIVTTVLLNGALALARAHFLARLQVVGSPLGLTISGQVLAFIAATVAFALVYKVLPDRPIDWRDVWVGAAATAVLFVIGQSLIAWFLAVAGVASAYGAAGSFLAMLLWLYYSATIFVIGAEFTKVHAERHIAGRAPIVDINPS